MSMTLVVTWEGQDYAVRNFKKFEVSDGEVFCDDELVATIENDQWNGFPGIKLVSKIPNHFTDDDGPDVVYTSWSISQE